MKTTQDKQVIRWLNNNYTLTAWEAANYFGIYRLAAIVHRLKKQGWEIRTELKFEGSKHWAVYQLEKSKP